jgi:hypothetical protein
MVSGAAARVTGVGVTTQWSGTVPLGADGEPLGNAIIWMDARGARHIRQVTGGFPAFSGYGARKLMDVAAQDRRHSLVTPARTPSPTSSTCVTSDPTFTSPHQISRTEGLHQLQADRAHRLHRRDDDAALGHRQPRHRRHSLRRRTAALGGLDRASCRRICCVRSMCWVR